MIPQLKTQMHTKYLSAMNVLPNQEIFMRKFFPFITAILTSIIFTGCSSMNNFSKSLGHHEVYTETIIPAEPEEVWAVITDAPNYKNWNPVIINAVGAYAEGATIINTVVEDGKKPTEIKSKVVKFEPPFHLNQFGGYKGIITFDHHYILEKVDAGTKVIQKEEYTGFYVNFWDSAWVEPAYRRVNEALKQEVTQNK